jgi:hypothetical protein
VPPGLEGATADTIKRSIDAAFAFGYRIIMLICAVLSAASAAVAGLMIPRSVASADLGSSGHHAGIMIRLTDFHSAR